MYFFILILAHVRAGASKVSFWPVYACILAHIYVHACVFMCIGIQNEHRGAEEVIES